MQSVLPAAVSALCLACGLYALAEKGVNRVTACFAIACAAAAGWAGAMALLFQQGDAARALDVVKIATVLQLLLPPALYQFVAHFAGREQERRWVHASFFVAAGLGVLDMTTDALTGLRATPWGFYARAEPLHPLLLTLSCVVIARSIYIAWHQLAHVHSEMATQLRLCIAGVLLASAAAVDHVVSYGTDIYPVASVFLPIGLGLIVLAITRRHLMSPAMVAASVAHEMRTPMASIRMQADVLAQLLQELDASHQLAVTQGLVQPGAHEETSRQMTRLLKGVTHQVERSNVVIDLMLASSRLDQVDRSSFALHSMRGCVDEAVAGYPFQKGERDRVTVEGADDFAFHGSDRLMVLVLFNLIRNSLYAIKAADRGEIAIAIAPGELHHELTFTDTGAGIAAKTLPRVFEAYFTTKKSAGAGIGLAFSRSVIQSFGAQIHCDSVEGSFTRFRLRFPRDQASASPVRTALNNLA